MLSHALSVLKSLGLLGLFAGGMVIILNSYADFGPGGAGVFIEQKGGIGRQDPWLFSIYLHVIAGSVCLLASIPQFFSCLLRRFPSMHRVCGRIYAASVLLVLCPSGIYLALYAKGGWVGQFGFLLLGVAAFHTTLLGVTSVRAKDLRSHRRWMTRSFALIMTAVTFRVCHVAFYYSGVPDEVNYIASLWISILGNVAVAEFILRFRPGFRTLQRMTPTTP